MELLYMNPDLVNEINIELKNMEIIVNETVNLIRTIGNDNPDNIQKTALAAFASQFYNGVENILKRIIKYYNLQMPKGEDWHIQLLKMFSPNSNYDINIKFNLELYNFLNDLRRFRHYFFHGYSINIDFQILKESLEDFFQMFEKLKIELYKINSKKNE